MIVSAFVGSPSTLTICAPLNNGCSFQTNSSAVTTFIASCAIEAGTAKLIASPASVRSKRIFIDFSLGVILERGRTIKDVGAQTGQSPKNHAKNPKLRELPRCFVRSVSIMPRHLKEQIA